MKNSTSGFWGSNLISLITTFNPKVFDKYTVEQAINSWLSNQCVSRVIVYGVPAGTLSIVDSRMEFYETNEFPSVKHMLDLVAKSTDDILLGYINSDIIILNLEKTINEVLKHANGQRFLISSLRKNVEKSDLVIEDGKLNIKLGAGRFDHAGLDVFIYSNGALDNYPFLWIANGYFDYTFIREALRDGLSVYDATGAMGLLHVDHEGYSSSFDYHARYMGEKYKSNRKMSPWWSVIAYPLTRSHFLIDSNLNIKKNSAKRRHFDWIFEYFLGVAYHCLLSGYPYTRRPMHLLGRGYRFIFNKWKRT